MNHSALLIGPQAIGKSRMAQAMMAALGATALLDDWNGEALPAGALAITNDDGAARHVPEGTVIYRVESREELQQLLTSLCPVCRNCRHRGRLPFSVDTGCRHPINTQWDMIDGAHVPLIDCKEMRSKNAACGPTGKLFERDERVDVKRFWPISVTLGGTLRQQGHVTTPRGEIYPAEITERKNGLITVKYFRPDFGNGKTAIYINFLEATGQSEHGGYHFKSEE